MEDTEKLFYILLVIILILIFALINSTLDYKIEFAKKIKIGNAVYQCEKKQELDLGDK